MNCIRLVIFVFASILSDYAYSRDFTRFACNAAAQETIFLKRDNRFLKVSVKSGSSDDCICFGAIDPFRNRKKRLDSHDYQPKILPSIKSSNSLATFAHGRPNSGVIVIADA